MFINKPVILTDIKRIHGLPDLLYTLSVILTQSNDIADVVGSVPQVARSRTMSTFLLRAARASSPAFTWFTESALKSFTR